jgi:hypothetical protein
MSSGGGGSGGGTASSTTTTSLPGYELGTAKQFLNAESGLTLPGGQLAPYPTGLNQNVAPFTPAQTQALTAGQSLTAPAQSLANQGAATTGSFASGAQAGPNPTLNAYYNQAAQQLGQNYTYATQPALAAQAQQAGAFNSSGYNQAQGLAQYGLGQSLATLGANIYEPAYQQGQTNELNAATTGASSALSNLYQPTQQLYNIGSTQQQQAQNTNNAATANAAQQANWPYSILSQLGAALGQASGGGGTTVATGPAGAAGSGGLFGK